MHKGFPHVAAPSPVPSGNVLADQLFYSRSRARHQLGHPYGKQTLWPDHCVQGTAGAAFHRDLDVPRAELVLRKGFRPDMDSYSAFYENDRRTPTGLAGYLRERGFARVFLVGLATDFCVHYSAVDARREGFAAVLVEDGCRAIDLARSLAEALGNMAAAGVERMASDAFAA